MTTVREILDAALSLPRPDRLRLAEQLNEVLEGEAEDLPLSGVEGAKQFRSWLEELLSRAPKTPVLPAQAFSREQIYTV
jgi:hypothetical protein